MKNQRTHLLIRKPWRRLLARLSACSIPAIALGLAFEASPQTVLFSDDFDTDSSAQWEVFEGSDNGVPDYSVDWAFDYGSVQYTSNGVTNTIPPAPNADG